MNRPAALTSHGRWTIIRAMRRSWIPEGVVLVLLALLGGLWVGCEGDGDNWVAPPDINGTWAPARPDATLAYDTLIDIGQQGVHARVTYTHVCRTTNCAPSRVTYPARYDLTSGVLTVQYALACWVDHYRFRSDHEMYRVTDPNNPRIHGVEYLRQTPTPR